MSRLKTKLLKKIVTAAAITAAACSDGSIATAPVAELSHAVAPGQTVAAVKRADALASDASVTKVIGPGGGTIEVAGVTLDVPRGALARPVAITATVPAGDIAQVHFAPHGLVFAAPVTLTLSTPFAQQGAAVVYFSGDVQSGFVQVLEVLTTSVSNGVATAQIRHFSGYTVANGRDIE